jgi:hypothetical protein
MKKKDRQRRLEADLDLLVRKMARKSKRIGGMDPNDRHYDFDLERQLRRMDPIELDRLLRGDYEEDSPEEVK